MRQATQLFHVEPRADPGLVKPKPLSYQALLLLSCVKMGKLRTRKGEGLAQQASGKSWVSLAQPRAFLYSCPSSSPLCHTSSGYDMSLQMARMPARVSGMPWHKGPVGKSASLASRPGQSLQPALQHGPTPSAPVWPWPAVSKTVLLPFSQGCSSCLKPEGFSLSRF